MRKLCGFSHALGYLSARTNPPARLPETGVVASILENKRTIVIFRLSPEFFQGGLGALALRLPCRDPGEDPGLPLGFDVTLARRLLGSLELAVEPSRVDRVLDHLSLYPGVGALPAVRLVPWIEPPMAVVAQVVDDVPPAAEVMPGCVHEHHAAADVRVTATGRRLDLAFEWPLHHKAIEPLGGADRFLRCRDRQITVRPRAIH